MESHCKEKAIGSNPLAGFLVQIGCRARVDSELTNGLIHNMASSRHLRTPPHNNLPSGEPQKAPLSQVLTLGNQTLMNRAPRLGLSTGTVFSARGCVPSKDFFVTLHGICTV
jgi:hypothetical protein